MKAISRIGAILFVASAAAGYGQMQTGGSNAITSDQIEDVHNE